MSSQINETLTTGTLVSKIINWLGGAGTFFAQGPFAADVVTLEYSRNNGARWTIVQKKNAEGDVLARLTDEGSFDFDLAACQLRIVLSADSGAAIEVGTNHI